MAQLLYIVSSLYTLLCPYTKVEESFNLQAAHDLLYLRFNFSQYDHHEFPGVVPRSFIGPLYLAALSSPLVTLFQLVGVDKFWSQYIVRMTLALCVISAWSRLRSALHRQFGSGLAWWFTLISATQYHFMFYMSRPLPNIVAMPLVLLAMESWLMKKTTNFILYSGAAIIIFRAELALLFGLFLLIDLVCGNYNILKLAKVITLTGVLLVAVTVCVDSIMWRRLLWPEAEVFYFNTILNKSGEWGTSPFLWYFYSALPRGLGASLALLPLGLYWERRTRVLVLPAVVYVLIFSLLPHKELRFIIYVFPLLNVASAAACNFVYTRRKKDPKYELIFLGIVLCIVGNVALSTAFLSVATTNYPGGVAITRFHKLLKDESYVHVHISNLAAQTGVSRFMQSNANWRYSKNESLEVDQLQQYTHLIVEAKSKYSPNLKPFAKTHAVLDSIESFSKIEVSYKNIPPVRIKTKQALYILQRNDFREFPHGHQELEEAHYSGEFIKDILDINDAMEFNDNISNELAEKTVKEILYENEILSKQPDNNVLDEYILQSKTEVDHDDDYKETESVEDTNTWTERKRKAIEKIKSETRKSVIASAKAKLKEIMDRHKHVDNVEIETNETKDIIENIQDNINIVTDNRSDQNDKELSKMIENETNVITVVEQETINVESSTRDELSTNLNVENIIEEVIQRLIERKIYDDKTKPEDITPEDRQLIQDIVEEVVAEQMVLETNYTNERT